MMLRLVPPVGSRMQAGHVDDDPFCGRLDVRFYGSGTSALAAALVRAARKGAAEVLIPAYGCPALVAAIRYAGLAPVLLDLAPSSPFVSASSIERRTSSLTAAVVHVNFLGLPPAAPATGSPAGITNVYDCCQGWPTDENCPEWADMTVLSFGRGKPITVGGGGALLLGNRANGNDVPAIRAASEEPQIVFRARRALYNCALHPLVYWWVEKLPGLHVGETRYNELRAVEGMSSTSRRHLAINIAAYRRAEGWTVAKVLRVLDTEAFGAFELLPALRVADARCRLLRLPLLASSIEVRDAAVQRLRREGFGATALYKEPLWRIHGLRDLEHFREHCPNADDFAGRLLTLPLHEGVERSALDRMMELLRRL